MVLSIINLTSPPPNSLVNSTNLIGSIIISLTSLSEISALESFLQKYPLQNYWVYFQNVLETFEIQTFIQILDAGAAKVVVPASLIIASKFAEIPTERLAASLSYNTSKETFSALSGSVSGYIVSVEEEILISSESTGNRFSSTLLDGIENFVKVAHQVKLPSGGLAEVGVIMPPSFVAPLEVIQQISFINAHLVIPTEHVTTESTEGESLKVNIADVLTCSLISDRPDGLFTTIVVDERGVALGVVYTSKESLRESLRTGKGVYQSRKRGLWYKGATSGAVQELRRVDIDCDSDALRFVVKQHGSGFCHLNTRSCFGPDTGLNALEKTLISRKTSAPVGSYTQRLFQNPDLLRSKIMEEADELCSATTKNDIAWEAADLIYFTLAKCIANNVTLSDVEEQLDKRAKKITRRLGNAKPQWDISAKSKSEATTATLKKVIDDPSSKSLLEPLSKPGKIKMQKFRSSEISAQKRSSLLLRPIIQSEDLLARVRPIVEDVQKRGDAALLDFTLKFDGVDLKSPVISAPFSLDAMALDDITRAAIDQAYENIYKFHEAQYDRSTLIVETMPGVLCSRFSRPIEKVGLYVPGGTAILPSTTLMLGIPAKVAGCKQIIIVTPPRKDGTVVPEVLYVAHKVGATKVVLAGGAQAVAALAYGTESIPKVDKICGPGNQYVTAAKMLAQNDSSAMVAIDMPAGPSELLVIADNTSNPIYVASDLLSQAEHGTDSQVVLVAVSLSPKHLEAIEQEIHDQASRLPRVEIVRESIAKSFIWEVDNMEDAMRFSNDYAPEHLILHLVDAEKWVEKVENAGSVFVGSFSPESCGDYASGTNHTLPTYGYARMYSGVSTLTFLKHITAQQLTKDGLNRLGDTVMRLAEVEGLEAHRNAVAVRIKDLRKNKNGIVAENFGVDN
ncbi:hypothetical protein G9A89_018953 [Geosiphon pyriformis]|nr:hypothetical protein G9A89_018953 [Geosiphon pyriformis]